MLIDCVFIRIRLEDDNKLTSSSLLASLSRDAAKRLKHRQASAILDIAEGLDHRCKT